MKQLFSGLIMGAAMAGILFAFAGFLKHQTEARQLMIRHYEITIDSLDNEYNKRFRWHHTRPMRVDTTLMEQDTILSKIYYYKSKIKQLLEEE